MERSYSKVYGSSDDLIEFEGDLYGEISAYGALEEDPKVIKFSDGTLIHVYYEKDDKAIWGIDILEKGSMFESITICDDEDADIYSDIVMFKGGELTAKYLDEGAWRNVK